MRVLLHSFQKELVCCGNFGAAAYDALYLHLVLSCYEKSLASVLSMRDFESDGSVNLKAIFQEIGSGFLVVLVFYASQEGMLKLT